MKKYQILFLAIGVSLASCEKDNSAIGKSNYKTGPEPVEEENVIAQIDITATSAEGSDAVAKVQGYFGDDPSNQFEPSGSLDIEGETPDYDNGNQRYYERYYSDNPIPQGWYGSAIHVSAYDSEFGDIDISDFYVPNLIKVDQDFEGQFTNIDRSEGLDVTWNADADNENPVVITIFYRPIQSQDYDPSLPSSLGHSVVIETEDDGEHHIPASELEPFPVGSALSLRAGRGNGGRYETSNGKFVELSAFTLDDLRARITQP